MKKDRKEPFSELRKTALDPKFSLALCFLLTLITTVLTAEAQENIIQNTESFDMRRPIAPTKRWTQRIGGLCGQECRNGPRHMYSASFENRFFMSWMAVDDTVPSEDQIGWVHYGNISTFEVSESGEFSQFNDVSFEDRCEAIYGITTNSDGSVIAILCKGYPESDLLPDAYNLLSTLRDPSCGDEGEASCYPIGHYCESGSPLYIFEYTGGQITNTPDQIILINHAVGGWNYGHHELSLNSTDDIYFVAIKVTSNGCDHEGLKHFGVRRTPNIEYVQLTDEWACSGGHTTANRIAYNRANDFWSILCTNDLCDDPDAYSSGRCIGIDWSTIPGVSYEGTSNSPSYHEGLELLSLEAPQRSWNLPGGGAGIVSLGNDGWLALAPAPSRNSSATDMAEELGLVRLPVHVSPDDDYGFEWHWLNLPESSEGTDPRFGMANLAYFSREGENSERLLLGWSPTFDFQGIVNEYVVSEVDREGRLRGEQYVLDSAGWGEDNRWVTMPNSGCVVFPFAWVGDGGPGDSYPIEGQDPSAYPTLMHLTSLCPSGSQPPPREDDEDEGSDCSCTTGNSTPEGLGLWLLLTLVLVTLRLRKR